MARPVTRLLAEVPGAPFPAVCLCLLLAWPGSAVAQHFKALTTASLGEDLTCLGMSHRNPNFVMVGTAEGRLLLSEDGGATWQRILVAPPRDGFYGRGRSDNGNMEYYGSPGGKSAQLYRWTRGKGWNPWSIGRQTLIGQRAGRSISINWIEVDWNDENRIYLGTTDGLYRSVDRGRTWIRIFAGRTQHDKGERMVMSVATDPSNSRHILVGTASGIFTSHDRGATYFKTMNYYLRTSYIREIWFDPTQAGLVHVAMGGSAMASPDGGKNWITTHWDQWGPRADVQSLSLGPDNLRIMGTRDGVFASWQGGEMGSWVRRGWRFVGDTIQKVVASQDPRLWFALTGDAVWVTYDSGNNWSKMIQLGGSESAVWLAAHNGNPAHLWLVTNRQVYRMGTPRGLLSMRGGAGGHAPRSLLAVPGLQQLTEKVLKHNHLHFADTQRMRERGPWASLLPTLTVGVHYAPYVDLMKYKDWVQHHAFEYSFYNSSRDAGVTWEVFANWDLSRLIFDLRELPAWGRVYNNLNAHRRTLIERVGRLYQEYGRAAQRLVFHPPASALTRSYINIRLQEINAYLDGVSGGFWTRKSGGDS